MTTEEAIEKMEELCKNERDYFGNCLNASDCADCEVRIAIDAIKKRIPIRSINGMSCPCGRTVVDRWSVYKFCPRCGQALDWED